MANFYGYVILILGMSLLFSLAGLNTGMDSFLNIITPVSNVDNNVSVDTSKLVWTSNSSVTGLFASYNGTSSLIYWIAVIVGAFILVAALRASVGGVFGIPETIKVTIVFVLIAFMIADMAALLTYINTLDAMGGVVKAIALLIYIPLTFGMIISAIDWIGGGR
jgi:hypothetical protein